MMQEYYIGVWHWGGSAESVLYSLEYLNHYPVNASIGNDIVILVYAYCPCIIFNRGSFHSQKDHPNYSVTEQHMQSSSWPEKNISHLGLTQAGWLGHREEHGSMMQDGARQVVRGHSRETIQVITRHVVYVKKLRKCFKGFLIRTLHFRNIKLLGYE